MHKYGGELDRQRRARVIAAAALTSLMVALSYKLYTDHRVASPGDGATTGDDESNDNGTSRSRVGRGPPSESWTTHFTHLIDPNPPGVWGPPTATIDWCARHDSAEDFCRLKAPCCTTMDWIFIPAYCFAIR